MKVLLRKAFKFCLKAKSHHHALFSNIAGAIRLVWNKFLFLNKEKLKQGLPIMRYQEMAFWLTLWKKSEEYSFLREIPSQVLQQKLKDLDKAFTDCFDKKQPLKRLPCFKKKGLGDSFRFPQGFKVEEGNNRLFLPKTGWVSLRKHRKIKGIAKNITVSRQKKAWFTSIQTEEESPKPVHPSQSIVGIDRGVVNFAVLSDESKPFAGGKHFRNHEKRLGFLQKCLSKKKKFSENWKKAKEKITNIHSKIANGRKDFLHKASNSISKSHAVVVLEDLKIKNMTKSAKGTLENKGRNIKQKSGLNKSILDQGWGMFKDFLFYKLEKLGGMLVKVPPKNTSRRCSYCGYTHANNRITQSEFECLACGHQENADVNAAKNILAAGHAVLACGDDPLGLSVKQEPSFA